MSKDSSDIDVGDQAFELIFALHDEASRRQLAQIETQISQFKARSVEHQNAITRAETEWALMGQVEVKPLTVGQKISLFAQNKTASVLDNPLQLVPVAAVLLVALLMPLLNNPTHEVTAKPSPQVVVTRYETAYGQQSEVTLADNSTVALNWNTKLKVTFSKNRRNVEVIKGEALFSVAKNPHRPFIVSVGGVQARAVGTEFSVQKIDDNHADIAVTEGVVEVSIEIGASASESGRPSSQALPTVQLQANDTLIATNAEIGGVHKFSMNEIRAWRSGMLVFNKRPLTEVLTEMNRYTRYDIRVEGLPSADVEVTATYFIDQMDEALSSLLQLFDLQAETQMLARKTTVVIKPALPKRPPY